MIHECIKLPEIKIKNKCFLKLIGFLVDIKPLSYLCLLNVVLILIYWINYKSKPSPTSLFGLGRARKWIHLIILTNGNPLPSALGRDLEYLAQDQESPNVCGVMSPRHGGWRELPGMETVWRTWWIIKQREDLSWSMGAGDALKVTHVQLHNKLLIIKLLIAAFRVNGHSVSRIFGESFFYIKISFFFIMGCFLHCCICSYHWLQTSKRAKESSVRYSKGGPRH